MMGVHQQLVESFNLASVKGVVALAQVQPVNALVPIISNEPRLCHVHRKRWAHEERRGGHCDGGLMANKNRGLRAHHELLWSSL
jgi:hypothetical protein